MKVWAASGLILIIILFTISACTRQAAPQGVSENHDPELYFVRGYRSHSDPCKLTGETEFTNQFLDHTADLVSCPKAYEKIEEFIKTTGAISVARTENFRLFRVPRH